jgi:acylphosphatase
MARTDKSGTDNHVSAAAGAPGAVRRRVVVHGHVHGVGFRMACSRRASAAGLGGWVRNRSDGTVEAVFEGAPDAVDALVAWCAQGPSAARVTSVERHDETPVGETSFSIR